MSSANHALQLAFGRRNSEYPFLLKVELVKGMPFYGYYENERTFMKLILYPFIPNAALASLILSPFVFLNVSYFESLVHFEARAYS